MLPRSWDNAGSINSHYHDQNHVKFASRNELYHYSTNLRTSIHSDIARTETAQASVYSLNELWWRKSVEEDSKEVSYLCLTRTFLPDLGYVDL